MAALVRVEDTVVDYNSRLVAATREAPEVQRGCSVRAGLGLMRASKVWAAASGRNYVTPDDIKSLAAPVLAHRMVLDPEEEFRGVTTEDVVQRILSTEHAPQERVEA